MRNLERIILGLVLVAIHNNGGMRRNKRETSQSMLALKLGHERRVGSDDRCIHALCVPGGTHGDTAVTPLVQGKTASLYRGCGS